MWSMNTPLSLLDLNPINHLRCHLFGKVQVVSEPLPSENSLDGEARITIGEGQEEIPASND